MIKTQPLTITLPVELLAWVDELAKQNLETRSDVLRQAALSYIRNSGLDTSEITVTTSREPRLKSNPEPKREYDLKTLTKKYPYVQGDRRLLEFLDDYEQGRL